MRHLLVSIDANVGVRADDGSHGHGSTEVRERIDRLAIPGDSDSEGPNEVRNEEYNCRLVEAIEHVHPELQLRVLQTTDASNV